MWESNFPLSELQPKAGQLVTEYKCIVESKDQLRIFKEKPTADDCKLNAVNNECEFFLFDIEKGCRCCLAVEENFEINNDDSKKVDLPPMYEVKHKKLVANSQYAYFLVKMYQLFSLITWDQEFLLNVFYL